MPAARQTDCLSHVHHVVRTGEPREVSTMVRGRLVRTTYVRTPAEAGEVIALIIKPGAVARESAPGDEVVRIHSQHQDAGRLGKLSKRELEVLRLIAAGMPSKVIAQHLGRTVKTVEAHRASLGRKLGVINRVQLARIAIDAGLVPTVSETGDKA
jgi:DNA-binding NarL/FixJ family response regulator